MIFSSGSRRMLESRFVFLAREAWYCYCHTIESVRLVGTSAVVVGRQ